VVRIYLAHLDDRSVGRAGYVDVARMQCRLGLHHRDKFVGRKFFEQVRTGQEKRSARRFVELVQYEQRLYRKRPARDVVLILDFPVPCHLIELVVRPAEDRDLRIERVIRVQGGIQIGADGFVSEYLLEEHGVVSKRRPRDALVLHFLQVLLPADLLRLNFIYRVQLVPDCGDLLGRQDVLEHEIPEPLQALKVEVLRLLLVNAVFLDISHDALPGIFQRPPQQSI
jgi:hypothetical protein